MASTFFYAASGESPNHFPACHHVLVYKDSLPRASRCFLLLLLSSHELQAQATALASAAAATQRRSRGQLSEDHPMANRNPEPMCLSKTQALGALQSATLGLGFGRSAAGAERERRREHRRDAGFRACMVKPFAGRDRSSIQP